MLYFSVVLQAMKTQYLLLIFGPRVVFSCTWQFCKFLQNLVAVFEALNEFCPWPIRAKDNFAKLGNLAKSGHTEVMLNARKQLLRKQKFNILINIWIEEPIRHDPSSRGQKIIFFPTTTTTTMTSYHSCDGTNRLKRSLHWTTYYNYELVFKHF